MYLGHRVDCLHRMPARVERVVSIVDLEREYHHDDGVDRVCVIRDWVTRRVCCLSITIKKASLSFSRDFSRYSSPEAVIVATFYHPTKESLSLGKELASLA